MKALIKRFRDHENLLPFSAGITMGLMLLLFILTQILHVTRLSEKEKSESEKMQVFELIRMKFAPEENQEIVYEKTNYDRTPVNYQDFRPQTVPAKTPERPSRFTSLAENFDRTKFINENRSAVPPGHRRMVKHSRTEISTYTRQQSSARAQFDFPSDNSALQTTLAVSRRVAAGGAENTGQIYLGGDEGSLGHGAGIDGVSGTGVGFSDTGRGRAQRGSETGSGSAKISLPSGSGGNSATLDLHALIRWMKSHPKPISKLVAYNMEHSAGDLSSAVSFRMNGQRYDLFLSCNEIEMLLRICLVDGKEFILLKDNGIKETSNFLMLGNVVRSGNEIRSLISSRQAPAGTAAGFYRIFWSWWQNEQKIINR